jgi:hypothetical protein
MKRIVFIFLLLVTIQGHSQNQDFYFTNPKPGARFVNPEQTILLKSYIDIISIDASLIRLSGPMGEVPLDIRVDKNKIIFLKPLQKLYRDSEYQFLLEKGSIKFKDKSSERYAFNFITEKEDNTKLLKEFYFSEYQSHLKQSNVSENSVISKSVNRGSDNAYPTKFPEPIFENINNPDPRPLLTNMTPLFTQKYNPYIMMLDNYGTPIYFKKISGIDLKVLPNGDLAYAFFDFFNPTVQFYLTVDHQYKAIDTIRMGNGYFIDNHDLLSLENGHYLTMAYDPQIVDMSKVVEGGNPEAVVTGLVIQEVDTDQNVYFEWRSWDHMEITDASDAVDLTAENIDYVHANAFEFDQDGNLLVSQRHMDEITKINYETGEIIWRMGLLAKKNQFLFNDTVGFTHQHDIRVLPNGNYTVYDNGNHHKPFPYSQAVEYQVDEENMTATKVWNFVDDPPVFAFATGSNRRITDERVLIGWGLGSWPMLASEVSLNGDKHFDMKGPDSIFVYRAIKHDWDHNVFTFNKDTLDFGEYDDYIPVSRTFKITNQMDEDTIIINSSHNHLNEYWLITQLPITLPPGGEKNIIVNFQPQGTGEFVDVLTLNYDNKDTTERIARQIVLTGRTPTGIHEYENDKVSVNPNPATDWIDIHIDFKGNKTIRIYNVAGQQLLEKKTNDQLMRLSTANLTQGVYTGLVSSNDGQATFRFIVK